MCCRCSGRRTCIINVPDPGLFNVQPCRKDLIAYFSASYSCVKGKRPFIFNNCLLISDIILSGRMYRIVFKFSRHYCLPEAGDIVMLPMKSVSLVVAYSSMLFPKLFHSPALPGAPLIAYHLSVDWHHSKRCVYLR